MHLPCLNMTALFIPLWRGSQKECHDDDSVDNWDWAVLRNPEAWKAHGKTVADATPFLPGSFDKAPRNPAEKIPSGYKAWEFLIYFFVLGPALFYGVLPDNYWRHYCKGVHGIRLQLQEEITPEDVKQADDLLTQFSDEFETLYIQRRSDCITLGHSIHSPSHFPGETTRIGPPLIYSQWTMECTIGNLGEEIKQHSDPYSNLAQHALRRCQVNAIKAMVPDIKPPETSPAYAEDLGGGFILLPKQDTVPRVMEPCEATALNTYLTRTYGANGHREEVHLVRKWGRLKLPTGQIARSLWCEKGRRLSRLRISRNVKVHINDKVEIAEIRYYVLLKIGQRQKAVAVMSLYSAPHPQLLAESSGMYWSMQHLGDTQVMVVDIQAIQSCVAVIPDQQYGKVHQDGTEKDRWYLGERPGLKLLAMIGLAEPDGESYRLVSSPSTITLRALPKQRPKWWAFSQHLKRPNRHLSYTVVVQSTEPGDFKFSVNFEDVNPGLPLPNVTVDARPGISYSLISTSSTQPDYPTLTPIEILRRPAVVDIPCTPPRRFPSPLKLPCPRRLSSNQSNVTTHVSETDPNASPNRRDDALTATEEDDSSVFAPQSPLDPILLRREEEESSPVSSLKASHSPDSLNSFRTGLKRKYDEIFQKVSLGTHSTRSSLVLH
ncbi:hypothetical protein C8J56DRAFT_1064098 [Mycena floridula]|nr:hypothetical protein C8J56DRAFT_1064098 [Mycena floridula]